MVLTNQDPNTVLVNPKLILFAFHLCRELTQDKTPDSEDIWLRCAEVGRFLHIPEIESLPQSIPSNQSQSTNNFPLSTLQEKFIDLLSEKRLIKFCHPPTDKLPHRRGGIYPFRLHDTNVVDLTIDYQQDRFPIERLKYLNPKGCLLPSKINASLGQTLLLFDRRLNSANCNVKIALTSIKSFIGSSDENYLIPELIGQGRFLGSNIYEFENDVFDPTQRIHFLVWFATSRETIAREKSGKYCIPLYQLLCSRHKIQFVYDRARREYQRARQLYGEIEPIINEFSWLKIEQNEWLKQELRKMKRNTRNRQLRQQIELLLARSEQNEWLKDELNKIKISTNDCQLQQQIDMLLNRSELNTPEQNEWLKDELNKIKTSTNDCQLQQQIDILLNRLGFELSDLVEEHIQQVSNKRLEAKLRQSQQRRLQKLENWLIQIPQKSVDYARCLRNIQTNLITININARNYERYEKHLQDLALPEDDLGFWTNFLADDCSQYREQIGYDLEYLTSGKALFERTIDSVRGLVAIDAQKQQLAEDIAEEERDRRIELWVTVVGSGLAVSALTSAIMPEPVQLLLEHYHIEYKHTWYGNQGSLLAWNVIFHSTIGILAAILVAIVFRSVIESFSRFLGNRVRRR